MPPSRYPAGAQPGCLIATSLRPESDANADAHGKPGGDNFSRPGRDNFFKHGDNKSANKSDSRTQN
jgi:hypothetical protein